MNTLDVLLDDVLLDDDLFGGEVHVGALSRTSSRTGDAIHFEYDPRWLDRNATPQHFALDLELPLARGKHFAQAGASELTAAFRDCAPDRWGTILMKRREAIEARAENRRPRLLRPWDYLVGVSDEGRMGAIRLRERDTSRYLDDRSLTAPPITDLRTLEAIARIVEEQREDITDEQARWIRQLIAPGASLGGARPKAGFRDADGSLWIAKFPSTTDEHDVGLWEYVTHRLALEAGITMPPARLLALSRHGHTFAVRRFDRTGGRRRCYASAMTMLGASISEDHGYLDIAHAIERYAPAGRISDDLEQLFRRVVFGILIGNRDDHLRNHGFLRDAGGWSISPAFDINPSTSKDHHVLAIDEADRSPSVDSAMRTAAFYRIKTDNAKRIVDGIRTVVATWERVAKATGARASEIHDMRAVVDPDR